MPSIKQEDLDSLHAVETTLQSEVAHQAQRAKLSESRVSQFDSILDAILQAANGLPIGRRDDRNMGLTPGGYGYPTMGFSDPCGHARVPSDQERHEAQLGSLQDRVVDLERRLAGVVAAAQFAKEHKA